MTYNPRREYAPLTQRRLPNKSVGKPPKKTNSGKPRKQKHASEEVLIQTRTIFPSRVKHPNDSDHVLVSGHNNAKIGKIVEVGRWKGMHIYTLTLEERATCPSTCHFLKTCYGNNMPFSIRYKNDFEVLKIKLKNDLERLNQKYNKGFVIRLHILGDFFSVEYVNLWRKFLLKYPTMRVFGYTAWPIDTPIGATIKKLRDKHWDRFAIRFSRSFPLDFKREAVPFYEDELALGERVRNDCFVCPAQLKKDKFCANCAACWESDKNVAFLSH